MSDQNDGGAAFPLPRMVYERGAFQEGGPQNTVLRESPGMSLRDWFAGMALQGTIASMASNSIYEGLCLIKEAGGVDAFRQAVAQSCYSYADAMLAARWRKEDK